MDFIDQVPHDIMEKTDTHQASGITLFKPLVYMGGISFNVTDYHIVIPSECTPDAVFNNKLIHGDIRKILIVNPEDTVNCLKNAPAKPYYSIMIRPDFLNKIAREMEFPDEIRFQNVLNPFSGELLQVLKSFERELNRPDRLNLLSDSLEIQIGALLLREFKTNMKIHTLPDQSDDSYIRLAIEFIRTYFSANITLEDICEKIHVSRFHFIRMFRRKTGLTPHRYLVKVRIDKAKELLGTGRYSVAETAVLCGFENIPHFSDTFKKTTGYSPVDYKKLF